MRKLKTLLFLLVMATSVAFAQDKNITGHISESGTDEPLPGVSIVIKGTTVGTVTDLDGNYNLTVPADAETLVFSFIGMETIERAITSDVINVLMGDDAVAVEEVMVVAYGVAKKESFTGSATSINNEKLKSNSSVESVDKALAGKVSGVRISSTNGDPGSAGEVQIRGVGSMNASTQPLYVIDGVPMETGDFGHAERSSNLLATMNPDDIETMTVLKDAAAASLYGSRAANGVIIITTKKGKEGKTQFNFKAEHGISELATNSFEMMSGSQYEQWVHDGFANEYLAKQGVFNPSSPNYGNRDAHMNEANAYANGASGAYINTPGHSTDYRDIVYGNGSSMDYQFSASGGNEKTNFYAGAGYNKVNGMVLGTDFERISGRVNLNHKANNWFSFGVNQSVSNTTQNGKRDQSAQEQGIGTTSPLGILFQMNPTAPAYLADGSYNPDATNPYSRAPHPEVGLGGTGRERETLTTTTFRYLATTYAQADITDDLMFKTTVGVDHSNIDSKEFWSPYSLNGMNYNGYLNMQGYNNTSITNSNILSYTKTLNEKHNINAIGGMEVQAQTYQFKGMTMQNMPTDKLDEASLGTPTKSDSQTDVAKLVSYLSSFNYNYDNRYYASASLRADGSSRLASDNRWGQFWSVSGSWRISQENFMADATWVDDLKVRSSYGTNGTLPPGYYDYMSYYFLTGSINGGPGYFPGNLGNDELTWEKSKNFNVGVDFSFLSRFNATVEYYNKYTDDLIIEFPTSWVNNGFGSYVGNAGSIINSGVEFQFNANIIDKGDWRWDVGFNVTKQKAIVDQLPNNEDIVTGDGGMYIYREGESMYSFYLPEWAGVDSQTGLGTWYKEDGSTTTNINEAERRVVGKAVPDFMGSVNTGLKFKNWELSALVTYSFGGEMFNYPGYFSHHDGLRAGNFTPESTASDYWQQPGDDAKNPIPVFGGMLGGTDVTGSYYRSDQFSSRHILSTDHIRLKELRIGYTLPKQMLTKAGFSDVTVYFVGGNLLTWTKEDNIEPEVPLNGYRTADTPAARTYTLGVNLSF
ncbi:SusC/RagA family TonB-linked outer membrane protein [Saccharicrinis aurantiacus]|uniref:SusC/RagA family TonB-linked outer membrane protein n=1 Tax=Saccharicrinis aurantiacus TaxID=1849719 RepID=UPI0009F993ED|nr:TonB-dependent receptor [Saccharicrinis aurantiacus]